MTALEWIYDARHITKKLKEGAEFNDAHALLSLNQYRAVIIEDFTFNFNSANTRWFQRHFISPLSKVPFSDVTDITITSEFLAKGEIPGIIGNEDVALQVFSSTGHLKVIRTDQDRIAKIARYKPSDYAKFLYYFITGTEIYLWPFVDEISVSALFGDPMKCKTTKILLVNGVTESPAGTERDFTIYDEYPFDEANMVKAMKIFLSEKYGISAQMVEDVINDDKDIMSISRYAKEK